MDMCTHVPASLSCFRPNYSILQFYIRDLKLLTRLQERDTVIQVMVYAFQKVYVYSPPLMPVYSLSTISN